MKRWAQLAQPGSRSNQWFIKQNNKKDDKSQPTNLKHQVPKANPMFEIKVPEFGESIQEVQVASWMKQPGDWIEKGEDIVELESEKASQALSAEKSGTLTEIKVAEGEFAQVGDLLCIMEVGEKPAGGAAQPAAAASAGSSSMDHAGGRAGA